MSVEYKDSGITFENRNFDGVLWYQPRALSESLSDSVTPSDSLIKGIDPVYADSASASDAIVKSFSIPLADSMTPSDDLVKLVSIPLADSVTVNDEIFNHPGKYLTDLVTASDAIIEKDVGKPIVDSISPVDELSKYAEKPLSDAITASDEIVKHPAIPLNDAYTASDLLVTKHIDKPLTDTVTTPDSLVKDLTKPLSDSVIAEDTKNVIFKDRDNILFESREGVIWTETKRDLIVKYVEKPLTDVATSVDLITTKHFDQLRTDSVIITDNIYKHLGLFFWDEYEYSDLITIIELVGSMPYVRPENAVFSEMRIKSVSGREPSNFYEVDEQGEEE